jgi:hypothetical protein
MCCRGAQEIANAAYLGGFLCSGLLSVAPRIAFPVVSEWYQKATGDASRPLYNERSFFTFTVPGVRGDASSLDRYSHWIASMGRHAAEGMDEALG